MAAVVLWIKRENSLCPTLESSTIYNTTFITNNFITINNEDWSRHGSIRPSGLHKSSTIDAVIQSRTVDGMQTQANDVIDELFQYCTGISSGGEGEGSVPWLDCARSYGLSEKVSCRII